MKITVVGVGYVGLVSGTCLAELGHNVCCLDTDNGKIDRLSKGEAPIFEKGLEGLLQENLARERIFFTDDWAVAIPPAQVVLIAVGTPTSRRGNGYADTRYIQEAARLLAPHLSPGCLVVNKSTVPVGTARQVGQIIRAIRPQLKSEVAANPEFLREGQAVRDFFKPDRIVLGTDSAEAAAMLREMYRPLLDDGVPLLEMSPETAELTKYASNAFLATKISFINEMANLCEAVGADVDKLIQGMGLDNRIGPKFLQPGPGFGGSCLPKDAQALTRMAQEHGLHCQIVETVVEVNHAQKAKMVHKIRKALGEGGTNKTLAVLGLTFKPETDDMREAPSLTILPALTEKGVRVRAHDPQGMAEASRLLPEVEMVSDPYAACDGADGVCLLTEWKVYQTLDLKRLHSLLKRPLFIDLRNAFLPSLMKSSGFEYVGIGRPPHS